MTLRPKLTVSRVYSIYEEMISCRRDYCEDHEFFRMADVWEWLCEESSDWFIKTFRTDQSEDFKRKAGVVAFANRVKLVVDERLMQNSRNGCKLANFMLAHELGHIALDHHATSRVVKNFQLFDGPSGKSNIPPTREELEANFAAVFFQCGSALMKPDVDPIQLAHRSFSDVNYVRKALKEIRKSTFQSELRKLSPQRVRLIL